MQGIIGVTICFLVFLGLDKLFEYDPFSPERIKDWRETEGTIVKDFLESGGDRYYVEFWDEAGKHLGESLICDKNAFHIGDKVKFRYNMYSHVNGIGVDARVVIEDDRTEESNSKFYLFLLCAIGLGIFDVYLIIQEIMKLVAN